MTFPPLRDLVPHEPPMLLLDRVNTLSVDAVVCESQVTATWPFAKEGRVDGVVLLELMAQTMAAFVGLERRRRGVEGGPRVGYLVGAQGVLFHVPALAVGVTVSTEARMYWHEGPLARFECRVKEGTRALAEGVLTAYDGSEAAAS